MVAEATIRVVLILMIMGNFVGHLVDVNGAFLHGKFDDGEKVYMKVPQGFEKHFPEDVVLWLQKTQYGIKQAAYAFWLVLLAVMRIMGFDKSKADSCLYFKWKDEQLVMWISWVDDCLCCAKDSTIEEMKNAFKKHFACDDVGEMKEYIGCKVERNRDEGWLKFTQPVLLQSYQDEFKLPKGSYSTPGEPGKILEACAEEEIMEASGMKEFRSGTGKLIHMKNWSRPDVLNATRELS